MLSASNLLLPFYFPTPFWTSLYIFTVHLPNQTTTHFKFKLSLGLHALNFPSKLPLLLTLFCSVPNNPSVCSFLCWISTLHCFNFVEIPRLCSLGGLFLTWVATSSNYGHLLHPAAYCKLLATPIRAWAGYSRAKCCSWEKEAWKRHLCLYRESRMISEEGWCATSKIGLVASKQDSGIYYVPISLSTLFYIKKNLALSFNKCNHISKKERSLFLLLWSIANLISWWQNVDIVFCRILAPTTYIFFASAIPVISFGEQLERNTGNCNSWITLILDLQPTILFNLKGTEI